MAWQHGGGAAWWLGSVVAVQRDGVAAWWRGSVVAGQHCMVVGRTVVGQHDGAISC